MKTSMKAKDVMTTPVVTIAPSASVRELAELLRSRRISGVPVVSNGTVVGMVSEGDLLRRHEIGTDRFERSWWSRLRKRTGAEYVRSHARRAADIMSRPVVSVDETTPIADIVSLFEKNRIRRVPVIRGRRLIGMVSRADLVSALLKTERSVTQKPAGDEAIQKRLLDELDRQPWWQRYSSLATVSEGVVHYWGLLDSEDERQAARVAAENIPGVRDVVDHRKYFNSMSSML
jgi:CBS domain-containing protein